MVKIFLDGASLETMDKYRDKVAGFTTNPSLMKKAGITSYPMFIQEVLEIVGDKPVSFEVTADDEPGMWSQASRLAAQGENVYVKIPCTNTQGESTLRLVEEMTSTGIKVNVTAVMTMEQVNTFCRALRGPSVLSIFAGRIADTGRSPMPQFTQAMRVKHRDTEVLWASTREVYNYVEAQQASCDIITMTPELIDKLAFINKDLREYSLETVQQFFNDAKGIAL